MDSNAKGGGGGGQKPNAYFLYGPGDVDFRYSHIIMFMQVSVKLIFTKK